MNTKEFMCCTSQKTNILVVLDCSNRSSEGERARDFPNQGQQLFPGSLWPGSEGGYTSSQCQQPQQQG